MEYLPVDKATMERSCFSNLPISPSKWKKFSNLLGYNYAKINLRYYYLYHL